MSQLFLTIFVIFLHRSREAMALSFDRLEFYDNLRAAENWSVDPDEQSNVVRVTAPAIDYGTDTPTQDYRLCHIPVILPLTDGDGNPQLEEGVFPTAAAMLAMLHFNERNGDVVKSLETDSDLRSCDVRFTMSFHDSKFSPIAASRILLEDLLTVNHSLATPKPCALVGTFRSAVTGPLATMATVNQIPVISPVATSSQLDKSRFGLLGRTIPSDAGAAIATATYMRDVLNVTHCGVIYVRDEFGTSYATDFSRAAFALDPPMVVKSVPHESDEDTITSIQSAVDELAETGYNYFMVITNPQLHDTVVRLASKAGILGPGKFWMLAEGAVMADDFSYDSSTQSDLAVATSGMGMVQPLTARNEAFENWWSEWIKDTAMKKHFLSKMPVHVNLTDLQFESPTLWDHVAYDAVMSLGIAACQANETYFNGTSLFKSYLGVSFRGASGNVTLNRRTGTRDSSGMPYTMTIVNANAADENGDITFNRTVVARLATLDDPSLLSAGKGRKWTKLAPTIYASGNTSAPPSLPPVDEEVHKIGPGVLAVGLILAACVMILSICWMSWTIVFRHTRVVHKSHGESLLMLCIGSFIMACVVIPMSLQEPLSKQSLNIACMSIPWLFQVGFVLAFSALASKTSINNTIYSKAQQFIKSKRRAKASSCKAVVPFALISSVNVSLLVVWTVVSPSKWKTFGTGAQDVYGRSIESYGQCESSADIVFYSLFLAIDAGLLIAAIILYYNARNVASLFNETSYILISMSTILQAFAVGAPSLILARTPEAQFLTRSVLVTVIGCAVLLPMFVPKEVARKNDEILRASRNSSLQSRFALQEAWNGLANGSSRVKGLVRRSKPDFFSSIIYETGDDGSRNMEESDSEEFCGACWKQGLDALAL